MNHAESTLLSGSRPFLFGLKIWQSRFKFDQIRQNWFGSGILLVTSVFLAFFLIYPVGVIIIKAFFNDGLTFQYFELLGGNRLYSQAILNSLLLGLVTTLMTTLLSLPLALVNDRWVYPGKSILSGLLLVPMVMPPFVGAIGLQRFFARRGTINLWLMDLGLIDRPIDWLGSENMFWGVVLLEVLHLYPIMYLNLSAALANIDPSMDEAAVTVGVPRWKRYRDIIWPLASPGYFAGASIVFVWAFTDLGTPLLVGFHETIPVKIFNMISDVNDNPIGYALVVIVILLTVCFFLASKFFVGRKEYQMMAKGHVATNVDRANSGAVIFIYFLILGTVILALLPHFSVLVTSLGERWFMTPLPENWTLNHYSDVLVNELSLIGIKNSLFLSGAATILDVVLGFMIAYVIVRRKIPFPEFLDALVMIPLALPGIILAFGYVVTYTDTVLDPMDNPVPLLIIAYGVRRLPFMVRSAIAGLEQTSFHLEEASQMMGASQWRTLRQIVIPLVTANLVAGGLLCFSYAMLDVSDSLILAMKDQFYPLTKSIYALFLEHGKGDLIASALGVIGMMILTVCILTSSTLLGKKMGELFRS